jgi:hypothetical protein
MKIVQQTPSLLKLQLNNIGSVILGIFFSILLLSGGLFGILGLQQNTSASWFDYIRPIVFILLGSGLAISNLFHVKLIVSYIFDKSLGLLTIKQETLFTTQFTEWQLEEISFVQLENRIRTIMYTNQPAESYTIYNLKLVFKFDRYVSIFLKGCNADQSKEITRCVRQFINR